MMAYRYVGAGLIALTMLGGAAAMRHAATGVGTVVTTIQGMPREAVVDT